MSCILRAQPALNADSSSSDSTETVKRATKDDATHPVSQITPTFTTARSFHPSSYGSHLGRSLSGGHRGVVQIERTLCGSYPPHVKEMHSRRYGSSSSGPPMPPSFSSSLPQHASPPSIPSSSYPYAGHPGLPSRAPPRAMKRASSSSVASRSRGSRSQPYEMPDERPALHYAAHHSHSPPPHVSHAYSAPHQPPPPHQPAHSPPHSYNASPQPYPTAHSQQQPAGQHSSSAGTVNQQPVNSAYITNLQQQIYFLELELQLLKQTHSTLPANGAADPDAPIDSLVTSLREKYIQQTAQHDTLRTELQHKLDASTQQLQLSDKEKERLALELDGLKERMREWKETARQKRTDALLWEKRAKDIEAEAAEKQTVLSQRLEKVEVQVRQQCVERAMCEERWKEESKEGEAVVSLLRDEVHQLRERNHALQQREVEMQHQLDVQPHHALREEVERMRGQQREREKHWREMQLKLQERDEQVAVLERQRDGLSEENYELRKKLEAEEQERRRREDEEAVHAGGRQKWSEELVKGRHAHAAISDEVAACKDRIEQLKLRLREEKEEKLGLLHTVKEWEQRIARQQHDDDKLALDRQQQKQQLDQLTIDFHVLRDEHAATQQRLAAVETEKTAVERQLDERDVELQRLRKQSDLLRLMEGVNVHEMTAAASSHQRMADVIGRLAGQLAAREADEDKREAGRYRVDEMNAGGLESARSEPVVKVGRDRDEEKVRDDLDSEDGSTLDSPRSQSSSSSSSSSSSASSYSSYSSSALSSARSSLPSRPSTGSSISRPSSAISSASAVSAVSEASVSSQHARRGKGSSGKSRSTAADIVDRQRLSGRPSRGSGGRTTADGSDVLLYS